MRMMRWLVLGLVAAPVLPARAQQITARTELAVASGYLWRGIARHRYPVAQLFGSVSRRGMMDFELSAWTSAVTGDCGQTFCAAGTGPRIADVNASFLARFSLGDTRIAIGANGYHFHPPPFVGSDATATTWEAVASVYAIASRHLQLGLTASLDMDEIDGLYVEATGTLPVTLRKAQPPSVFFTATAGWNHGQHAVGGEPGYYAERGFTHLSVEMSVLLLRPDSAHRGRSLQLFGRLQGNFDPATRVAVWPWARLDSHQQFILGLVLHPIAATGYRRPERR